ncbi:MAG: hypothetical protein M3540_10220, partial [Actinomycetota bacterium]|nr:hypothetical protein [Actinomycetota bacterium]
PLAGARACRQAQAAARGPLLCPARLPRPVRSLARNSRFSKLTAEALYPRPHVASGVSFSYGERPLHASWRLRPCCFLHFTIERYETLLLRPFRGKQVTMSGQSGSLARPIPGQFGLYEGHYLFKFRHSGMPYLATLHGLENEESSMRVLRALIGSLVPVRELPRRYSSSESSSSVIESASPLEVFAHG